MVYTCVCKHCFQVFKSKIRTMTCCNCRDKDDDFFDDIETYLKLYPNSNALQISEELGIPAFVILKYLEEGRLCASRGTFSRLLEEEEREKRRRSL